MNKERIALGLMIFILAVACFTQVTSAGCSKPEKESGTDEMTEVEKKPPFFERNLKPTKAEPSKWYDYSKSMMDQMKFVYEKQGFTFERVAHGEEGTSALLLVIQNRSGIPASKQIADAMYILHENFPKMAFYRVQISGIDGASRDAVWDDVKALYESGYSFSSSAVFAEEVLGSLSEKKTSDENSKTAVGVSSK